MTSDTAAHPYWHVRKEEVRAGSATEVDPPFASFDVVLRRDYDALLSELAAARQENERLRMEQEHPFDATEFAAKEAELVVVRRQLRSILDVAEWMSGSPSFAPEGEAHEGWLKMRPKLDAARAVLDAGQQSRDGDADAAVEELRTTGQFNTRRADDRWHNQIGCWCEQRSEI